MKDKNIGRIVVGGIVAIFILMVYNVCTNCDKFFEVNVINCINTIVVIGVSFFIVQRQTDKRKQKDIFISLLEALKNLVDDEKSYNFIGVEKENMLMRMREITLKVEVIERYSEHFKIEEESRFLSEKLEEYVDIIDNHSTDMNLLCQLHKELKRPLNLMSGKIFDIMLNLYK